MDDHGTLSNPLTAFDEAARFHVDVGTEGLDRGGIAARRSIDVLPVLPTEAVVSGRAIGVARSVDVAAHSDARSRVGMSASFVIRIGPVGRADRAVD